jgi:hypothetical protein
MIWDIYHDVEYVSPFFGLFLWRSLTNKQVEDNSVILYFLTKKKVNYDPITPLSLYLNLELHH